MDAQNAVFTNKLEKCCNFKRGHSTLERTRQLNRHTSARPWSVDKVQKCKSFLVLTRLVTHRHTRTSKVHVNQAPHRTQEPAQQTDNDAVPPTRSWLASRSLAVSDWATDPSYKSLIDKKWKIKADMDSKNWLNKTFGNYEKSFYSGKRKLNQWHTWSHFKMNEK